LKNIFDKDKTLLFIDVGCGARTSGVAIASLYNDRLNKLINFKYLGIDIAGSMIEKANEFSKTELFDNESMFYFYENWDLITDSSLNDIISSDTSIIFNASYLFASSSLDEYSLAEFVNNIRSKLVNQAYFVFQNPDRADRNQKYNNFKTQVYHHVLTSDTQRIYYKNNSNLSFEPSNEIVNYEILTL
jgi:predicted TPR repeat methyltransferase